VLSLDEQVPTVLPGGYAQIGVPRFTGTVDDTSHDGDLERELTVRESVARRLGDRHDVDLRATTARTRDQIDVLAFPQAERLEQHPRRPDLLHGIRGERVADRVADPLGEQGRNSRGGLDVTPRERTGLGDTEMEW